MGCPIHIWAPLMAAMVPFARMARQRISTIRTLRDSRSVEDSKLAPKSELTRWEPIQTQHKTRPDTTHD